MPVEGAVSTYGYRCEEKVRGSVSWDCLNRCYITGENTTKMNSHFHALYRRVRGSQGLFIYTLWRRRQNHCPWRRIKPQLVAHHFTHVAIIRNDNQLPKTLFKVRHVIICVTTWWHTITDILAHRIRIQNVFLLWTNFSSYGNLLQWE
jgi:hypothetical protein